jgi:hypothetical protein
MGLHDSWPVLPSRRCGRQHVRFAWLAFFAHLAERADPPLLFAVSTSSDHNFARGVGTLASFDLEKDGSVEREEVKLAGRGWRW